MKDKLSMTVKVICGVFLAAIVIAFVGLVSSNNNLIDFYYTPYANAKMQLEVRMNMQEAQKQVLLCLSL